MLHSKRYEIYRTSAELGISKGKLISSLEEESMLEHYEDPSYRHLVSICYEEAAGIVTIEFVRDRVRKESISIKRNEVPHLIAFLTAAYEDSKDGAA